MATFWDHVLPLGFNTSLSLRNVVLLVIFLVTTWKILRLLFHQESSAPGPRGLPIIGNMLDLRVADDVVLNVLNKWTSTYGRILQFRPKGAFGPLNFLISDAEALKQVLVLNSKNYKKIPVPGVVFNKSLIWVNGKEHAQQRKMLHPIFAVNNLKGMVNAFKRKTNLLIKVWTNTIGNNKKDECCFCVQDDFTKVTLDIIGECVFGYQFNSITDGESIASTAFQQLAAEIVPFHKGNNTLIDGRSSQAIIIEIMQQMVQEKRKKNQASDKKKDLLDLFMEVYDDESGQRMSDEQLYSQVFLFMVAGHETTSITLTWTVYFLSKHPEIQEKVREEINEIIQDETTEWDTYESMSYLSAVINESLRLRPPAALFRRQAVNEDNILGHKIPAGSMVMLYQYGLHHCSEYWDDPETFNPDRFVNGGANVANQSYTFLPFSKGPRTCLGNKFALIEAKVVLSALLQNFSFSMANNGQEVKGAQGITYKPKPPLQLLVRKL